MMIRLQNGLTMQTSREHEVHMERTDSGGQLATTTTISHRDGIQKTSKMNKNFFF